LLEHCFLQLEFEPACHKNYCFCDFLPRLTSCRRHDLTEGLKELQCKTLIFAGESSPFHAESVYMSTKMDNRNCALVEVDNIIHSLYKSTYI